MKTFKDFIIFGIISMMMLPAFLIFNDNMDAYYINLIGLLYIYGLHIFLKNNPKFKRAIFFHIEKINKLFD